MAVIREFQKLIVGTPPEPIDGLEDVVSYVNFAFVFYDDSIPNKAAQSVGGGWVELPTKDIDPLTFKPWSEVTDHDLEQWVIATWHPDAWVNFCKYHTAEAEQEARIMNLKVLYSADIQDTDVVVIGDTVEVAQ